MKKWMAALLIGIVTTLCVSSHFSTIETALADSVLRLHVIANSDSDEDQALKLKVRDAIIREASDLFLENTDVAQAKETILEHLPEIERIAKEELAANGCDDAVSVSLGKSEFPTKAYKNLTLPAGTYDALKVEIGEAKGQNWWCVMFPPLCFVDTASPKMDDESLSELKNTLTQEEYDLITNSDDLQVEVKFKAYEIWQSSKATFQSLIAKLK